MFTFGKCSVHIMAAAMVVHVGELSAEIGQCALIYEDKGLGALSDVALTLQKSVDASIKRCKDKHLEECFRLLSTAEDALETLSEADLLPLIKCLVTCQTLTCSSFSSFQKLEKIIAKLSQNRSHLVTEQLESLLCKLTKNQVEEAENQVSLLWHLCMYLEGSSAGRKYFRQHLHLLISRVSATFFDLLQNQTKETEEQCNLSVKVCLYLFKELGEGIAPMVWVSASSTSPLQSILQSLLKVITNQNECMDTRLLAGTAIASLANTDPNTVSGALAGLNLVQQMTKASSGLASFGELCIPIPCPLMDELSLIVVVRGLLTCGKVDLLTCLLPGFNQHMTALELLFPVVTSLCEGQKDHYYRYQVLCLWLQRVREQISHILKIKVKCLLASDQKSLVSKLLWTGVEMQEYGMSDLMIKCFQHFLHIIHSECKLLGLPEDPIFQEVLKRVMEISWRSRSRCIPLCAVLPFLGTKKVLELYPELLNHLFYCLGINYLCPNSSETYHIFINLQRAEWSQDGHRDENEMARLWAVSWLTLFCDALASSKSALQSNCTNHFLPCTLRCFPISFSLMADQLHGSGISEMYGWVSLVYAQKLVFGKVNMEIYTKLQQCLDSSDEAVRLCAFNFLCCSPHSSQLPSLQELEMLKKFLPFNMGCDSPGFRQQLQAVLRKALHRLRDGTLAVLRKRQSKEEEISKVIDFVEWLLQLSISCLSAAGNYQRRCTGLLTLCALLESCTDSWTPQRKKGQPPLDMSMLLNYAGKSGYWDFFSQTNLQALLGCVQDSTNEIREMASDLIVRFFPESPKPLTLAMFDLGKSYISSPRVSMAEAGALLLKIILHRQDAEFMFPGGASFSAQSFVAYLTNLLKDHYYSARENMLHAATCKPLHGVISALRLCLLEVPFVLNSLSNTEFAEGWRCLFKDLVSTLRSITLFILSVLYGVQGKEAPAAPSFADMGKAVGALIAQGRGLDDVQGDTFLSEEHSLIMTCCWVSLKEIGVLLGPLVEKISNTTTLLPSSAVQEAVFTYQDIFLRCRHWGAVEGCSSGFTRLCSALLYHVDPKMRAIPKDLITKALALCRSQHTLSVTRRAAGFPVLLQCILCAEKTQRPLLMYCVQSLLELAQEPLSAEWDQTRDIPQVSAVHALQTMLRCAGLRTALLIHAVPMMSLALCSLRSPCWAMHNAALQLFSALAGVILGLSCSNGDSSVQSTLSAGALLRRYSGLQDVLLQELYSAQYEETTLQPSVYLPLTLLAKLQPGGDSDASCLVKPLMDLSRNPIYAVRVMAAQALVTVVQVKNYHVVLLQLVGDLPLACEGVCHNSLHGNLLQIHALLLSILKETRLTEDVRLIMQQKLLSVMWLLSPAQRCPLVRTAFLDLLSLLVPNCGKDFARIVHEAILKVLSEEKQGTEVGSAVFHEACVSYICNEVSSPVDPALYSHIINLLRAGHPSVLKWLNKCGEGEMSLTLARIIRDTLQDLFCELLSEGHYSSTHNLRLYLESFVHLHTMYNQLSDLHHSQTSPLQCIGVLLTLLESHNVAPQLRGCALCTVGLLLKHGSLNVCLFSRWLSAVVHYADPALSCEVLRLAAAQALVLAGSEPVNKALKEGKSDYTKLAVRVIICGVDLLQDEDRGVREAAARFAVSLLAQPDKVTIHSDRALLHLFRLLKESFWNCEETFSSLILRLPPWDVHAAVTSLLDRSVLLYEEDEPNMFADSRFLSTLLLPLLSCIVKLASTSALLPSVVLGWVTDNAAPLRNQIQRCLCWCREHDTSSLLRVKASGCPHVHTSVLGLLIRGRLMLEAWESFSSTGLTHLDVSCLRKELSELQANFILHGTGSFCEFCLKPQEVTSLRGEDVCKSTKYIL
ncbi:hypothetical protein GDO86_001915 [Hymenochirus boettgeri]|uniref:DUF2428 domain-containing protein n=1 Tax=Hymenochirus boettgeri TaxID=247094 RepID=A0A8T2KFP0_9PIPI|nr:hypothetical protein GDO86_001915 [Hymenochirus boettgeri]